MHFRWTICANIHSVYFKTHEKKRNTYFLSVKYLNQVPPTWFQDPVSEIIRKLCKLFYSINPLCLVLQLPLLLFFSCYCFYALVLLFFFNFCDCSFYSCCNIFLLRLYLIVCHTRFVPHTFCATPQTDNLMAP